MQEEVARLAVSWFREDGKEDVVHSSGEGNAEAGFNLDSCVFQGIVEDHGLRACAGECR